MKRYLPIAIVVVLVLGGAATFALTRKKTKVSTTNSSAATQTNESQDGAFDALSTEGLSFVATITSAVDGREVSSVMESDGDTGAVKYTANTGASPVAMIYTKDAYYLCQTADKCYKYSLGQGSGASFDPKNYQYGNDKISQYKTNSTQLGTESCPAGTCKVWKVASNGVESKVYIDTKTKRVSQVIGGTADASSKIVYDYKDVTVEVPANAQELPAVSVPQQ